MKTLQTITRSLFITATLVLAASCNKDDAPAAVVPVVNNANNSFVTGKVDGAAFTSFVFGNSAASCSKGGSGTDQFVTVLGGDLAGNSITVFLTGNLAAGTYNLNRGTESFLNYSPGTGEHAYSTANCESASGTLVVTASDATHIEGTFSFVGKDTDDCSLSKTVTEGTFKGIYQN